MPPFLGRSKRMTVDVMIREMMWLQKQDARDLIQEPHTAWYQERSQQIWQHIRNKEKECVLLGRNSHERFKSSCSTWGIVYTCLRTTNQRSLYLIRLVSQSQRQFCDAMRKGTATTVLSPAMWKREHDLSNFGILRSDQVVWSGMESLRKKINTLTEKHYSWIYLHFSFSISI